MTAVVQHDQLYSAARATGLTGATYRMLDYWDRQDVLHPTVAARGSGSARRYSHDDLVAIRLAAELGRVGITDAEHANRSGGASSIWLRHVLHTIGRPVPAEGLIAITGQHITVVPDMSELVLGTATVVVDLARIHEQIDRRLHRDTADALTASAGHTSSA